MRIRRILKIGALVGIPAAVLFGTQRYLNRELPFHVKFVDIDGVREVREAGEMIGLDVEQLPDSPRTSDRRRTALPEPMRTPMPAPMTPPPPRKHQDFETALPVVAPPPRRTPSLEELRLPYDPHLYRLRELRSTAR